VSLTLAQIDEGMEALADNAGELIAEARLLHEAKAFPRAFALAHLAREELSKAQMLYAAGIRVLAKHPVDWKKLQRRLRDHKEKLRLEIVGQALLMKGSGDADMTAAADALLSRGHAHALTEKRNDDKNAALYVGLVDGKFIRPRETRTESQSWRTIELASSSHKDLTFVRTKSGPLAMRSIGSIQMPNFDDLPTALDALEFAAAITFKVHTMAHVDGSTQPE
jgi:AbiV family abortive infection protein